MNTKRSKINVAVLGATGNVGQKAVRLLLEHPSYEVGELIASEKNTGVQYSSATNWQEEVPCPPHISQRKLVSWESIESKFVISALPAPVAKDIEKALADRGKIIFSNASAYRMESSVPILIPEVNPTHINLIERQITSGSIITNSNCVVATLAPAIKPLEQLGSIEHIDVTTLQAISGAGKSGICSMDIFGNTLPEIPGEEAKIEQETLKILGSLDKPANFSMLIHTNRVPVLHGHTVIIHLHFRERVCEADAIQLLNLAQLSYSESYKIHSTQCSPQPRVDLSGNDYKVHVGRVKRGKNERCLGLVALSHNLVRGAAGAAILNLTHYLSSFGNSRGLCEKVLFHHGSDTRV